MRQFNVDGATDGVRRLLGLIFAREQTIKDAVVEAVDVLYLSNAETPMIAAAGLSELAATAALGELASLEDVLKALVLSGRLPASGAVMKTLWSNVASDECSNNRKAAALNVLTMCARTSPEIVRSHLGTVCGAIETASRVKRSLRRFAVPRAAHSPSCAARTTNRSISTIRCSASSPRFSTRPRR